MKEIPTTCPASRLRTSSISGLCRCSATLYGLNDSDLEGLFSPHGEVVSAQVITDRDTGRSKGFGFVEMGSEKEAGAAIGALNGNEHDGRTLTVNLAKPRQPRNEGFAGGGRRSRY